MRYQLGEKVKTKKPHPCGSSHWEIVRVGADIKIKCLGCGRVVMTDAAALEKILDKRDKAKNE